MHDGENSWHFNNIWFNRNQRFTTLGCKNIRIIVSGEKSSFVFFLFVGISAIFIFATIVIYKLSMHIYSSVYLLSLYIVLYIIDILVKYEEYNSCCKYTNLFVKLQLTEYLNPLNLEMNTCSTFFHFLRSFVNYPFRSFFCNRSDLFPSFSKLSFIFHLFRSFSLWMIVFSSLFQRF